MGNVGRTGARDRATAAVLIAIVFALASLGAWAQPIALTDQRGVDITLDGPVERVVVFPMPAASLFIAVAGSPDRLVGMHAASKIAIVDGILAEIFPEAAEIEAGIARSGFAPNVEAVLELDPDLVFQWATSEDLIAPLENAGVPVVGLQYGTQRDLEAWIVLMANAIGRPERADQILGWHHRALEDVAAAVAATPDGGAPRILYFNRFAENLRVAGSDTYNDFYIRLVGGRNAADGVSGFVDVDVEQVLAWNPDIILIGNFDAAVPEDVYARDLFRSLPAVDQRRVYKVPLGGYRWDPPNQEAPLMWSWLAMLVHPNAVSIPLRDDIRAAYRLLYAHDPTDAQIDAILRIDLNRDAAGYARFGRPNAP